MCTGIVHSGRIHSSGPADIQFFRVDPELIPEISEQLYIGIPIGRYGVLQEYIIYFIWQVVYEIACYDYTEFGIRIVVSVKSFAPYKLKRRVFPLWFLTMGSSSNRKLLRIRAKSVVFIRCLHLHINK